MSTQSDATGTAVLEPGTQSDLRTILLLDPVTLFLRFEETILSRRDWRIHAARTAEQAHEILEREHVDLLVLDHVLPDTTGEDFIRAVRANPRTRATGILVLTARGSQGAVDRCLEAGANGVMFKPVTRQDLCMRVEDLLYVAARRHVRTMVRLTVDASTGAGNVFGESINVSAGGMLLEANQALAMGEMLELRFLLPGDDQPIVTRARVVREGTASDTGRHATGLAFEGMTDTDRARIDAYVASARNEHGVFQAG